MHSTPWPQSPLVHTCYVCAQSISMIGCLSASKIPGRESILNTLNACSIRSSRPSQTALGWVCLSVALLSRRMEVGCQFPVHPYGSVFQVMLPAATELHVN